MNRNRTAFLLTWISISALLLCGCNKPVEQAPIAKTDPHISTITIKGIHIGMSKEDAQQIVGERVSFGSSKFTIGEVGTMRGISPGTSYIDGKLSSFYFSFPSERFDDVQAAVKSKYPDLKCIDSEVKNRMGASFQQVQCKINATGGVFGLDKYATEITWGTLFMASNEQLELANQQAQKKNSDI